MMAGHLTKGGTLRDQVEIVPADSTGRIPNAHSPSVACSSTECLLVFDQATLGWDTNRRVMAVIVRPP